MSCRMRAFLVDRARRTSPTFATTGAPMSDLAEVRHAADLGEALAILQPGADLNDVDGLAVLWSSRHASKMRRCASE